LSTQLYVTTSYTEGHLDRVLRCSTLIDLIEVDMKFVPFRLMPNRKITTFGLALMSLTALCGHRADAATLAVMVEDVHAGPGSIRVALYADPDSFRHEDRAVRVLSVPARPGAVTVEFKDIPAGRYAVLAYHDANDNKKLDLILGMFPDEGWGLSNDPSVMGPPRFEPSAFNVGEPSSTTHVRLHY
jgi:uncharacterized protein (DUF2141 family)